MPERKFLPSTIVQCIYCRKIGLAKDLGWGRAGRLKFIYPERYDICIKCGGPLATVNFDIDGKLRILTASQWEKLTPDELRQAKEWIEKTEKTHIELKEMGERMRSPGYVPITTEQKTAYAIGKTKCPHCQSYNTSKIGGVERVLSVATLGLASSKIGKQYKCNDCGHKW